MVELTFEKVPSLKAIYLKTLWPTFGTTTEQFIPKFRASVAELRIEKKHLAKYREVCGIQTGPHVPLAYPQTLAGGLIGAVLTHKKFPKSILGLVHVKQHFEVHDFISEEHILNLQVKTGEQRTNKQSVEIEIITHCSTQGRLCINSTATLLFRSKKNRRKERTRSTDCPEQPADQIEEWSIPAHVGRRYASVSGDYNPIHLNRWSARLLGFKAPIAHGMWSAARCMEAIDSVLPSPPYSVTIDFKRPIFIPTQVRFARYGNNADQIFALLMSGMNKSYLVGRVTPGVESLPQ